MQVPDVAFRDGDDPDARERQPLEQASGVFLVAREPIERLGEHHIEGSRQRGAHQRLEAGSHQRGAGHRGVCVVGDHGPALARGELATDPLLIGDRGRSLLVG